MPTDIPVFDYFTISPDNGKTWTYDPAQTYEWHEPRTWRCALSEWIDGLATRLTNLSFRVDPHREKASADVATFTFEREDKP